MQAFLCCSPLVHFSILVQLLPFSQLAQWASVHSVLARRSTNDSMIPSKFDNYSRAMRHPSYRRLSLAQIPSPVPHSFPLSKFLQYCSAT